MWIVSTHFLQLIEEVLYNIAVALALRRIHVRGGSVAEVVFITFIIVEVLTTSRTLMDSVGACAVGCGFLDNHIVFTVNDLVAAHQGMNYNNDKVGTNVSLQIFVGIRTRGAQVVTHKGESSCDATSTDTVASHHKCQHDSESDNQP